MRLTFYRLLFVLLAVSTTASAQVTSYDNLWSEIYRAELKSLTTSALLKVDSLYAKAKRENNMTQIPLALLYQSKFTMILKENSELVIVERFEKEISNSKAPLRNILESFLAELYENYFNQHLHHYVYEKRSRTAENVNPADFRTWDEDGMHREIRRHYQNSLRDASVLQTTKLEKIEGLLLPAEDSRLYRPFLYDLLAHRALEYYTKRIISTNSDNTTHPANPFAWDDPAHFRLFAIPSIADTDSLSLPALAIKIYHNLLNLHRNAFDTSALVNLEMERLDFLKNASTNTDVLYENHKNALQKLKDAFITHPSSAAVAFKIATMLKDETDRPRAFQNLYYESLRPKKLAALELCQWAIDHFADSPGGKNCAELKEHLLAQNLQLKAETFIPADTWSKVFVEYANVDRVSFSVVRISKGTERSIFQQSDSVVRSLLAGIPPEHRWVSTLTNPQDLLLHSTEVVIPRLGKGTYMIVAKVYDATDSTLESVLAYKRICVTNLVLIHSTSENANRCQVIDRINGKPIRGATVRYTRLKDDQPLYTAQQTTDKDGFIELKERNAGRVRFSFTASLNGDTIVAENSRYYRYFEDEDESDKKEEDEDEEVTANTQMFSDRAIYRPGQKIYFKGILLQHKNQKASVISGKHVHVILEDPNGVEVNAIRLKTNSFGSFSGSFVLPLSGLTGAYSLYADEDAESDSTFFEDLDNFNYNSVRFSVEEYKRPTFEAKFNPVRETFVLNDSVHVNGVAKSYSGSALKGAVVNYRIIRTIAFSYWLSLARRYLEGMDAQEIASGQITTDAKGEFTIPFKATAGDTINKEGRPVFSYSITADVIDINGETRSTETTVNVGYHVLDMSVKMDHTLDRRVPNVVRVVTKNLNEQFTPAKGTLALYKLKTPSQPQRHRPWSAPDLPILSEEAFASFFPYESYDEKNRTLVEQKGELLALLNFDTRISKDVIVTMNKTWPLGEYVVELKAIDAAGLEVVTLHQFQLHDPTSKTVPDQKPLVLTFDKKAYAPGEVAHLKIGSACSDLTVTVFIEKLQKINRITIEHLAGTTKDIAIPITENMGREFSVTATTSYQNSLHTSTIHALVALPSPNIEIETITFKDKLQPGAKETWSFEVKGPNGTQVEAEMLASMYDASLDQFNVNRWYYDFLPDYARDHRSIDIDGDESFDVGDFSVTTDERDYYSKPAERYDDFYWFGFNFTGMQDQSSYLDRIYPVGMTLNSPSIISLQRGQSTRKGYVQGTVVDSNGQPLPGVNVTISNTTTGAITDANGHYEVKGGRGDVIRFTFVGYAPAETKLGRKTTVNVTLKEALLALSEVVVTARGSYEKKALTQSITMLYRADSRELEFFLAGEAAGVSISSFNFTPGDSPLTRMRGSLYVVDGVIVAAREIEGVAIADVQLLKGEAATSLYGARAANGVVVIVTRAGQQKIDEEMAKVNVRKNFDETAFFFPHLTTDENGKIRFSFTTPEALTRWKLQLLAHTRNLTATLQTLQVVTQKELMITPNFPRFLRTGDEVVLSTKIVNLTSQAKSGKAILQLTDAVTGKLLDGPFGNVVRALPFTVAAKSTTEVSWRLHVPGQVDAVQYKIVAKAGNFSDGEQNILPVIPNRILVTESLPMHAQSGETKHFVLDKLRNTTSSTRQQHRLTLEVTSNPAWYAVQALPYLMEFPYECAEQLFARYYANALASHIANSNPKIKAVFEKWSSSGELVSALEKNPELKSIVLEETPWVRSAQNETEQKKRLGSLFDLHALGARQSGVLDKLKDMQLASGGFPWFNGGTHANRYITQHIVSGLGHLKHLNVLPPTGTSQEILQGALRYLDAEMLDDYRRLLKRAQANKSKEAVAIFMDRQQPDALAIHYLYMRSFFPEVKMNDSLQVATAYYRAQSATYWSRTSLLLKGMTALIHFRQGNKTLSNEILAALKENSLSSDALGMYWKENTSSWYWYESPIETQALLIEAFSEVQGDDATLNNLRVWLINHKQAHQWATTKATTEAIYAILLQGAEWLPVEDQLETTVGTKKIQPAAKEPEAGTGYFSTSWTGDAVVPELGEVTLTKKGNGTAWANLHWQYWEDLEKIMWAESSLKLSKKVFAVSLGDKGELLTEVKPNTPVNVGDLLRVRIELHTDRDLDFLHMKDLRASGVEPVDVHSAYKYQSGIDYYQSTRDASTNFFFDNLPKGVYIFEYDLRVNNRGNFSNGITTIQSMYAPEFGSHSDGTRMTVK
ncbi:alpha-2-macroglobulin family protein [Chryseolinea lacunae]|uniref:Carboxypeptidase-like regulatory domain-containing protein n=1 Tax=Chryseolinea lacunae TaxID=2801331 RepID=A0ABS1KNY4_9BACT|nr:MG2 domain-containing protein [Chryseolinea lacunae]MBL0740952.1 carboxypeptidase-like regulatory domain-containing protein [Chryseolinea lacunae]